MEKRIAFVEVPGQLPEVPEGYGLVALSPGVELALDREKRAYTRPEDYIAPLADEQWGLENYPRVEALCARLDEILGKRDEAAAEGQLRPAFWSLFFIKQVFDLFSIRSLELYHLLKLENPERILYFEREKPGPDTEWLHPRESAYAAVLDMLAPRQSSGTAGSRTAAPAPEAVPFAAAGQPALPGKQARGLMRRPMPQEWCAGRCA